DVVAARHRLAAHAADGVDHVAGRTRRTAAAVELHADVVDHHLRPLAGELERVLAPDAAPRARDDRHTSFPDPSLLCPLQRTGTRKSRYARLSGTSSGLMWLLAQQHVRGMIHLVRDLADAGPSVDPAEQRREPDVRQHAHRAVTKFRIDTVHARRQNLD